MIRLADRARSAVRLLTSPRLGAAASLALAAVLIHRIGSVAWRLRAHRFSSPVLASAAWGALLVVSFVGWGTIVNKLVLPRSKSDVGLRSAWGMSVVLFLGAMLMVVHAARPAALASIVLVGALGAVAPMVLAPFDWPRSVRVAAQRAALHPGWTIASVLLVGLALVQLAGSPSIVAGQANDDYIAYFEFPKKILATGTFDEPYSLRRVTAYGGQSLLHALHLLIGVPETEMNLIDVGVAPTLLVLLVLGAGVGARRSVILPLTAAFVIGFTETRYNAGGHLTGAVLFLGMFRTLRAGEDRGRWVLIALQAAGACSLRQSYVVPAGAFLFIGLLPACIAAARRLGVRAWRTVLALVAPPAVAFFATLLPWCVLSYISCRTILFPLTKGNFNPGYDFFEKPSLHDQAKYLWQNLFQNDDVPTAHLLFAAVPFLLISQPGGRLALRTSVLACAIGFLALVRGYPLSTPADLHRYYLAFFIAALCSIGVAAAEARRVQKASRGRPSEATWLVLFAFSYEVVRVRGDVAKRFEKYINELLPQDDATNPTAAPPPSSHPIVWGPVARDPVYWHLQTSVPAGERIAVEVDKPYQFDFTRNTILNLDMLGAVSPRSWVPYERGGDAVADYFRARSVRYLIVVDPTKAFALYKRDTWVHNAAGETLPVWKASAHFALEAFDAFDQLRATRVHVCDDNGMSVLDLQTRATP
jgi:hypothetical protein